MDKEMLLSGGGSLMALPIPTSILLTYLAILIIGSYRSVHLSLSVMFFSFILMFFATLIISTSQGNLERTKILLIIQYMLPMGALVLGEMFKTEELDTASRIERAFLFVLVIFVPLQLASSWLQGGLQLVGYLYIFSIYQYMSYVPIIFVSAYLLAIFGLWQYERYRNTLVILSLLMGLYAAASLSPVVIAFLIVGIFIFAISRFRLAGERLPAILFLFVLTLCIGYLSLEMSFLAHTNKFNSIVMETISSWQFYITEISGSSKSLFLGHVDVIDKSNSPGAHNYYFDMVRNFGILALVPMFVAFGFTVRIAYLNKNSIQNNSVLTGHLLVLLFLLVIDNSTQVSLRQPYSGVFTYFVWGLFIARCGKIPPSRRAYAKLGS